MLQITKSQLAEIRERFNKSQNIEYKRDLLEKSALFSFLSIQTKIDKHELSFKLLMDVEFKTLNAEEIAFILKEAKIPFYNAKSIGIIKLLEDINLLDMSKIKLNKPCETREYCFKNLRGLGYTKVSFMLALLGFNVACIDTHMTDFLKLAELWNKDKNTIRRNISQNKKLYEAAEALILAKNKFIYQWESFEHELKTNITHEVYFNAQL
jgi:thermostable 8-oxoguanine DNA glycosylase